MRFSQRPVVFRSFGHRLRPPVGVGEAETAQHRDLAPLHAPRVARRAHGRSRPGAACRARPGAPSARAASCPGRAPRARSTPRTDHQVARAARTGAPAAAAAPGTTARWWAGPGRGSCAFRRRLSRRADHAQRRARRRRRARPSAALAQRVSSRARRRPGAHAPPHRSCSVAELRAGGAHVSPRATRRPARCAAPADGAPRRWASKKVKATPSTPRSRSTTWLQAGLLAGRQVGLRDVAGDHGPGAEADARQEHLHLLRSWCSALHRE